jgi:hypothetical protein
VVILKIMCFNAASVRRINKTQSVSFSNGGLLPAVTEVIRPTFNAEL